MQLKRNKYTIQIGTSFETIPSNVLLACVIISSLSNNEMSRNQLTLPKYWATSLSMFTRLIKLMCLSFHG